MIYAILLVKDQKYVITKETIKLMAYDHYGPFTSDGVIGVLKRKGIIDYLDISNIFNFNFKLKDGEYTSIRKLVHELKYNR